MVPTVWVEDKTSAHYIAIAAENLRQARYNDISVL